MLCASWVLCALAVSLAPWGIGHGATIGELSIQGPDDNEILIQTLSPDSTQAARLRTVWFLDHGSERPVFDRMLVDLADRGIDVWRVDLLDALFLDRANDTVRTLSGEAVRSTIEAALAHEDLPVVLVSYDRMALPLLRGVRDWQGAGGADERLLGSALYYPNLFGPAPPAGIAPDIDPIVAATNYPLVIAQPALGSHRWRIADVMQGFWDAGSAATLMKIDGVRDWFFMGPSPSQDTPADPARAAAVADMPAQLGRIAATLARSPRPDRVLPLAPDTRSAQLEAGPQAMQPPIPAPALALPALDGEAWDLGTAPARVRLISFWATWCPPCVEELPSMNALARAFDPTDFEIISVNFQESDAEMAHFLNRVPIDFPVLMDTHGKMAKRWEVFSFPSTFILDRENRIRYSLNKAIEWNRQEIIELVSTLVRE